MRRTEPTQISPLAMTRTTPTQVFNDFHCYLKQKVEINKTVQKNPGINSRTLGEMFDCKRLKSKTEELFSVN